MAISQSAFKQKISMEDILAEHTDKLNKFIVDSVKKNDDLVKKINHLQSVLNMVVSSVNKQSASNQSVNTPPSAKSQINTNPSTPIASTIKEDTEAVVSSALKGWIPPETSVQKAERKTNKSTLKNIFGSLTGLSKKVDTSTEENRSGWLWNKKNSKDMWGSSASIQSPLTRIVKFLLSPGGLLLLYFVGKMFKKHIWDPYIGPVMQFYKEYVKPVLEEVITFFKETVIPWVTNVAMPFISSLFPKWEEIKTAVKEFRDVLKDPNATIGDKIAQGLLTGDVLLAPITNIVKKAFSEYIGIYAKALDAVGLGKAASWTVDIQRQLVDSMNGEIRDNEMKKLRESRMGQKYAQMWDPAYVLELNKKIASGEELKPGEKILVQSDRAQGILNRPTDESNKQAFEDFLRSETAKTFKKGDSTVNRDDENMLINKARLTYEHTGFLASKQILAELSAKKGFASESEAISYMRDLLAKHGNLTRSAEGQKDVLKELVRMLKEQGLMTQQVLQETNKLGVKAFQTGEMTNIMINNSDTQHTIRHEKRILNMNE